MWGLPKPIIFQDYPSFKIEFKNTKKNWKMLENAGKCWKMLENVGFDLPDIFQDYPSFKIELKNTKKIGKCWKMRGLPAFSSIFQLFEKLDFQKLGFCWIS